MEINWWLWVVIGVVLVLTELAITSFYVLWFGIAALVVAGVSWISPEIELASQLGIWASASVAMTVLWFRLFPKKDKTLAVTSGEFIGEVGILVSAIEPFQNGKVRFQRPIIGSDEWTCISNSPIPAGGRVRVVSIEGNILKISKAVVGD